MKKHYMEVITACDKVVPRYMKMTVTDRDDPHYGGIYSSAEGYVTPGASLGCMLVYTPAYYNERSMYYKDKELLVFMSRALDYTAGIQRENGTIDLLISNFSPRLIQDLQCTTWQGFTGSWMQMQ